MSKAASVHINAKLSPGLMNQKAPPPWECQGSAPLSVQQLFESAPVRVSMSYLGPLPWVSVSY